MVYVYDFQLLFIARVLGVGLLELYPNIGPEDDLYDTVTELRKPRKSAAPNSAEAEDEQSQKGRLDSGRSVAVRDNLDCSHDSVSCRVRYNNDAGVPCRGTLIF